MRRMKRRSLVRERPACAARASAGKEAKTISVRIRKIILRIYEIISRCGGWVDGDRVGREYW